MKKNPKVVTSSINGKTNYRWAFQTLILSICLSLLFGFFSQTILSSMGIVMAIVGITFFIFLSVIFDMIGIAVASSDEEVFIKWAKEGVKGAEVGLKLAKNSEKVCSFCADVVGDICSTLCGAGGACVVVAMTRHVQNASIVMLISICVSALIAGLTIFFKALMKTRALKNSDSIILTIGKLLEKTILRKKSKKR